MIKFYKIKLKILSILCFFGSHRLTQDVDHENGGVDLYCDDCGKTFMPSDNYDPMDVPPEVSWWNNLVNRK